MNSDLRRAAWVLLAALMPHAACAQQSANYPSKPIRLVVPQPPGGASDITMRLFAQKTAEALGQQIVVDNRAGGGVGSLATLATVAKANPDGYTLLAVVANFTFTPALVKDFPFDVTRDFAYVTQLTRAFYLLVTYPGLPVKSVPELIAMAKAQPGKLNFGAGNVGSGTHLITMYFITSAGINATYVPYKGTGPALIDLMGGQIHGAMTSVLSSGPLVKAGKLRALGISTIQRSKVMPEIPTIAEQGVPGYDAANFLGWAAPARTPPAILNRISSEVAKIARSQEIADKLKDDGGEAVGNKPEEFRKFIVEQIPRWRKLVKDIGITVSE